MEKQKRIQSRSDLRTDAVGDVGIDYGSSVFGWGGEEIANSVPAIRLLERVSCPAAPRGYRRYDRQLRAAAGVLGAQSEQVSGPKVAFAQVSERGVTIGAQGGGFRP